MAIDPNNLSGTATLTFSEDCPGFLWGAARGVPGIVEHRNYKRIDGLYDQDGLRTFHNHDFMRDPDFVTAYDRGIKAATNDYRWHWRVHIGLWAARNAMARPGDFVECGVNRGFLSSAIMKYLNWDNTGRTFYLLDTFSGLVPALTTEAERAAGILDKNEHAIESGFYVTNVEEVRKNFSEWRSVRIIEGAIPQTLDQIDSERIAFASIDMNCASPEVAAMEYLWDRFVEGAFVVFDDYAYHGYLGQKHAMDAFAKVKNVAILSLPTGQGLLIKPPGRQR